MRPSLSIVLILMGVSAGALVSGCQSQPRPTPEPTPTENVVVVVVTSTSQPTLAPTETLEATITPLATFTPIGLESPTPTPKPTSTRAPIKTAVPATPKAAATDTPIPLTATPLPDKYPAPQAISPTAGDSNSDHSDIQFYFGSVGPLGVNECYLLHVQMVNPYATSDGVGADDFLDLNHCGDRTPAGKQLKFVLYRPTFHNVYTFGTIERNAQSGGGADLLKLQWYVRVVQNNGLGPDGVHYNTTPLSPNSDTLVSDFHPQ
jgi:hypothetical protein